MNIKFSIINLVIYTLFFFSSTITMLYSDVSHSEVSYSGDAHTIFDARFLYRVADSNKGIFSSGFSIKDINELLDEFNSSFEKGDIKKFVSLFEENVKTEDGNSREILKKEYTALFTNTDRRMIKFKNATWKEDENGVLWGDIDFMLNIRNRIDQKISQFSGTMRIYFKKRNKTLTIDGFFHAYDEKTSDKNSGR